jgi:flagellar motor protein MotB
MAGVLSQLRAAFRILHAAPLGVCPPIAAALIFAAAGCQQNPATVAQQPPAAWQQQQLAMAQQQQTLQSRAGTLDSDNQELQAKLAAAQRDNMTLQNALTTTREQLNSTNQMLAQSREAQQSMQQQSQALADSMQKRSATMISANNSLARNLPTINLPGVEVRQDGDVVRVELPDDRLFNPGTAQLRQDGVSIIDTAAAAVARSYPNQIIGVEGHTDSDPPQQGMWLSNHQLSMARAGAVFDYLTGRGQLRPQQLFLVAHGANHPVVSNASAQGKARNRRVELVVYPDQWR